MIISPLEQFQIISIIPIKFGSVNISFTNSALIGVIAVSVALSLFFMALNKATLVPNRWQSIFESMYDFVLSLINENIKAGGLAYFPLIFTVFCFLLFCNLMGMVPYSFTVTSHIIVTFGLAMGLFVGINIIGAQIHGFHFFSLFLPAGVPLIMAPFLVLVELIGYSFRVVSIALRLFANMMAGHSLLKILAGFAWTMFTAGGSLALAHILPLAVIFAIIGLELGIAFLQAYVFSVLLCIYLNDAISLH
jgi:ATP synthase subunit 6